MKLVGIIPEARTRELETLKKQAYHFSFMKGPFLQHDRTQLKLVAISHMYLLKKTKKQKKIISSLLAILIHTLVRVCEYKSIHAMAKGGEEEGRG